jgi:hypothetical protein
MVQALDLYFLQTGAALSIIAQEFDKISQYGSTKSEYRPKTLLTSYPPEDMPAKAGA